MSGFSLASDALIGSPAAGQVEYNGQFFGTDSNAARAQFERLVLATAQASTSGTSIDFTSIPAWAKRITVMLNGVSTSGTSLLQVQLGTSGGGVITTGYAATTMSFSTTAVATANVTSGFVVSNTNVAADAWHGSMSIALVGSNAWVANGSFGRVGTPYGGVTAGSLSLGAVLDRIRVTTVNGTDTFDAGSINILYEG